MIEEEHKGIIRTIFTEDEENKVWDPLRIGFAIAFLTFICLGFYHVAINALPFDFLGFGGGAGALLSGTGAALWASSKQTPTQTVVVSKTISSAGNTSAPVVSATSTVTNTSPVKSENVPTVKPGGGE